MSGYLSILAEPEALVGMLLACLAVVLVLIVSHTMGVDRGPYGD